MEGPIGGARLPELGGNSEGCTDFLEGVIC